MATPADRQPRLVVSAAILIASAVVLALVLSVVAEATRGRIERNRQAWIQQRLDALVAPAAHDNDLLTDRITVVSPDILGLSLIHI